MRMFERIELTWEGGDWNEGVADKVVEALMEALDDRRYVRPDSVLVVKSKVVYEVGEGSTE